MKKTILPILFITSLLLAGCKTQVTTSEENNNPATRKDAATSLIAVDSENCKTSALPKKEFETNCNPISEQEIANGIVVKAIQVIPEDKDDEDEIEVGENVRLEFYVNDKKLDIPEQIFHSFWAEDYLSLGVSYKSPEDLYVYGAKTEGGSEYGYQFDGNSWNQTK